MMTISVKKRWRNYKCIFPNKFEELIWEQILYPVLKNGAVYIELSQKTSLASFFPSIPQTWLDSLQTTFDWSLITEFDSDVWSLTLISQQPERLGLVRKKWFFIGFTCLFLCYNTIACTILAILLLQCAIKIYRPIAHRFFWENIGNIGHL